MATQYSNKPIVTDGLVYALDFGNPKSYVSGSSTAQSLIYRPAPAKFETLLPGDYGTPAAAYSVRKVVSSYTGDAMMVQSASVSQSIGFDADGNLDTASLASFAGSGDAFVKVWYDQSGNGRHASQATAANQPQIVNAGSTVTQNAKPALDFLGNDYLSAGNITAFESGKNALFSAVVYPDDITNQRVFYAQWNGGPQNLIAQFLQGNVRYTKNPVEITVASSIQHQLVTIAANSTAGELYVNSTLKGTDSSTTSFVVNGEPFLIGAKSDFGAIGGVYNGRYQELIMYTSDRVSDREAVEYNINDYYQIFTSSYNPTPDSDNDFLDFESDSGTLNTQQSFPGFSYDQGNSTVMYVGETKGDSTVFTQDGTLSIVSTTSSVGFGSPENLFGRSYPASGLKHVTLRFSSGSTDCFINGVPVSASAVLPSGSSIGGGQLNIPLYTGSLGGFQVYNRPLTSDEIYNNYLVSARRYSLPDNPKPYTLDENAYLFLQSAGITDPIITSSIDTFVRGLKTNNLWDKMIAIYPFVGTGSDGVNLTGSQLWNLKEPSLVTYPLTFTGSWIGSTSGSAPSGSNTNISINGITPSQYYPSFNTQSAHISILSYDTPASSSYLMGTGMTEDLAVSTLAGDYGTPAAAYSVRKVRTAYSGALMDVRRSLDNVTSSIGYVETGDLDTGSLVNFVKAEGENTPGEFEGLAAAYSLRKVSSSYSGPAIEVNNGSVYKNIGFTDSGVLDTASLDPIIATGSNVLPGEYSGLAAAYSLRKVNPAYTGYAIQVSSSTGFTRDVGFDYKGNLDTGSLLSVVTTGSGVLPGQYDGLAAAYSLRKVSSSYDGPAVDVRRIWDNTTSSIGFDSNGNLDTESLLHFTTSGSNSFPYSNNFNQWTKVSSQITSSAVLGPYGLGSGSFINETSTNDVHAINVGFNFESTVVLHTISGFVKKQERRYVGLGFAYNTGNGITTIFDLDTTSSVSSGSIGAGYTVVSSSINYVTDGWFRISLTGTTGHPQDFAPRFFLATSSAQINANGAYYVGEPGTGSYIYGFQHTTGSTLQPYIETTGTARYNVGNTSSFGYVNTWYDQSGNGRHATQTATGSQPLIVSSGSVITNNGKPSIRFNSTSNTFLESSTYTATTPIHNFLYFNPITAGGFLFDGLTSVNQLRIVPDATTITAFANGGSGISYTDITGIVGKNYLVSLLANGADTEFTINGSTNITASWGTTNVTGLRLGRAGEGFASYYNGYLSEFLSYNVSQSANRTYIENNINAYYDIYNPTSETTEDAYVSKWYDQSGNNNHATQSVAASQPRIVYTGSIVTENGKPALDFDGSNDWLVASSVNESQPTTFFTVSKRDVTTGGKRNLFDGLTNRQEAALSSFDLPLRNFLYAGTSQVFGSTPSTSQELQMSLFNGAISAIYINSVLDGSGNPGGNAITSLGIGRDTDVSDVLDGKYQELILYSSDQSSNRTYIENNINAYYDIYTTSSTSTENAYVSTWYDQSGNGRHAIQVSASRQPLIVSSGSLVTENGKPALSFDGSNDVLQTETFTTIFQPATHFSVTRILNSGVNIFDGQTIDRFSVVKQSSTQVAIVAGSGFTNTGYNQSTQNIIYGLFSGSNSKLQVNNNQETSGSTVGNSLNKITIGAGGNLAYNALGSIQEYIFYTGSQETNRELLKNNINNYYNIYTGSNHGFVERWYDQSGNNRHAVQTATGSQPIIVESGSLITRNSRPYIEASSSRFFTFTELNSPIGTDYSLWVTYEKDTTGNQAILLKDGGNYHWLDYGTGQFVRNSDSITISATHSINTLYLINNITNYSVGASQYRNESLVGTRGPLTSAAVSNQFPSLNFRTAKITFSELIFYPSNQSSNREAISYGINDYYNIYTQPTSSNWTTSSFTIKADSTSISGSLNNKLTSGIQSSGPLGLVTVSRTGSDSLTIARNGATTSFSVPASGALSTGLYLGAINNNGLALGNSPLNLSFASVGTGLTDSEVSTYNRLVNNLKINTLSPGVVTDGLVLFLDAGNKSSYPGTGNTWSDFSGNNNNGTLINGPTFDSGNGGSIVFDGTNDYVNCGDIIRGRTTFSAEAWINTTDTRVGVNETYHNPSIFGTQHGGGVSGDFAMTLKSGYLGFYHELGGVGHIDTGVFVADGTWRHVAVIKTTGGTMTVYHNGTQVYTGTGYTATLRTGDLQYYNWELGRAYWYGEDSSMMRYTGRIGAHKLYNRALTQDEITQNFNATRGRFGI